MSHVYLVKIREHARCGDRIMKIGYSCDVDTRLSKYPKGSILVCAIRVVDGLATERKIKEAFKVKFEQRRDYGTEYFEGPEGDLLFTFMLIASMTLCTSITSDSMEVCKDTTSTKMEKDTKKRKIIL